MAADPDILDRLDRIQATLQLAYSEQLRAASERLRSDPVTATILELAEDWVSSSELQTQVAKKLKVSDRTVRNRLVELTDARALIVRGGGRPQYRSSGLV
jgi:transcription initiation factor TFIIIB Brf1 subunit/transcription initiation factor TFIIB